MLSRPTGLLSALLLALGIAAPAASSGVTAAAAARPAPAPAVPAARPAPATHDHPASGGAAAPSFTPAEYTPACSTTHRTFVFYMSPSDRPYRYDGTMIARLRTYVRQMTGFIRSEGFASSANTKGPVLKVACNSDGSIRVGGLRSTTTSSADSFSTVIQDLKNAGFNDANTKYLVFYDDPTVGKCGNGEQYVDDTKSTSNWNNGAVAMYSIVYGNTSTSTCWAWNNALHELMHNMGAVQPGAPNATTNYHCKDGLDVMCYDDSPNSGYTSTRCSSHKLDCGYDTYFDTSTEYGEWLSTHWNVGWSGNYFLQF